MKSHRVLIALTIMCALSLGGIAESQSATEQQSLTKKQIQQHYDELDVAAS